MTMPQYRYVPMKSPLDVGPAMGFAAAYNNTGNRMVVGGEDCTVRIYHTDGGYRKATVALTPAMAERGELQMPITALRFRPGDASNVLLVAACNGAISMWHVGAAKVVHSFMEEGNGTYAADYSKGGAYLATGGTDGIIRIYDAAHNCTLVSQLSEGPSALQPKAHNSRIQSLRFVDDNVLLSGGWDRVVNIWDVRVPQCASSARPVGSLDGPYLCGDGMDVSGNNVVCASSERYDSQLELFDLRRRSVVHCVSLAAHAEGFQPPSLYAARFSPKVPNAIAIGGTNYAALYTIADGALREATLLPSADGGSGGGVPQPSTVFCAAWDPLGKHCFVGGRSGAVFELV